MVSHSEFPPASHAPYSDSLAVGNPAIYEVIVPVFLRVRIKADDDLHAEVLAQEAVRKMGPFGGPFGLVASVHSIIAPAVKQHPPTPSS